MNMPFFAIFLLLTGYSANDLVSLIDAEDYFTSRQMKATVPRMLELAGKNLVEGKDQAAQLLAIRWLGEHAEEIRKDKTALETLEAIVAEKKGRDARGFTKNYALKALGRIDPQRAPPPRAVPENSLKTEAFQWFPAETVLFGALDLRSSPNFKPVEDAALRTFLAGFLPPPSKAALYDLAQTAGNVRIDRFSFGFIPNANDGKKDRVFVRFTGLCEHKRLAQFLEMRLPEAALKKTTGPQGEPITIIHSPQQPPAFALVGDADLLMAAYDGEREKHVEVVEQALEALAGRKANLASGPQAAALKKVPPRAGGLLMGELPPQLRKDLFPDPQSVLPKNFTLDMTPGKSLDIRFVGVMASAADAKAFLKSIDQVKQVAAEELKKLPAELKIKPEKIELLQKTIAAVKMEVSEATVTGSVSVSAEVLQTLQELFQEALKR